MYYVVSGELNEHAYDLVDNELTIKAADLSELQEKLNERLKGMLTVTVHCQHCEGEGSVNCGECIDGIVDETCNECDGTGNLGEDADGEQIDCECCEDGVIEEDCSHCNATGEVPCPHCDGEAMPEITIYLQAVVVDGINDELMPVAGEAQVDPVFGFTRAQLLAPFASWEDTRNPGDPYRRGSFIRGYEADHVFIKQGVLTWASMGNILGFLHGQIERDQVVALFDFLADGFTNDLLPVDYDPNYVTLEEAGQREMYSNLAE